MTLKYAEDIKAKSIDSECPFNQAEKKNLFAFRFSSSDPSDSENYIPKFKLDVPKRTEGQEGKLSCGHFGLSMFDKKENANKVLASFTPKIKKKRGWTHLSKGRLTEELGVCTEISKSGHFDFFEEQDTDLAKVFELIEEEGKDG
ncbi:hypothetical protein [Roseivirga pacifica]|uniref:hypothetical protein n=1 Tax=Roseivirga pacifica TaxID=1267423 RepID=UPI003BA8F1D2